MTSNVRGFALIQAILLSLILAALATTIIFTAKNQVTSATALSDLAKARNQGQDALERLLFQLSSQTAYNLFKSASFNYYSQPFEYHGVTVEIQALAGLFKLSGSLNTRTLEQLLAAAGESQPQRYAQTLKSALQAREEVDRRIPQTAAFFSELGMSKAVSHNLLQLITSYPVTVVSPILHPAEILQQMLSSAQYSEVMELREQNTDWSNYRLNFRRITGIEADDLVGYTIGPYLRIVLRSKVNESQWQQSYTVEFKSTVQGIEYDILSSSPVKEVKQ